MTSSPHILRSIVVSVALASHTGCAAPPPRTAAETAPARVTSVAGFSTPETAKYDLNEDVFFVSNVVGRGEVKDDNGFISRVRPDGRVDSMRFIAGGRDGTVLNGPKGMAIRGDTLWVADIDAVRAFNKVTGAPLLSVDLVPAGARFLNDVEVHPDGSLYVTDTGLAFDADGAFTGSGDYRVFRIAVDRAVTVAVEGDTLAEPNGIAWDPGRGRFLIAPLDSRAIFEWTPGQAAPSVVGRGAGNWDGVEVLGDGRLLVSSMSGEVDVVHDGAATRLIGDLRTCANIGFDAGRRRLAIPLIDAHRVEIWQLPR